MGKKVTTLRDAFAHFGGAKAANPIWGWSARSADGSTVVLTAWEDEFNPNVRPAVLDVYGHKNLAKWTGRRGNRDRIKNLLHARDHCGGLFRIVMVKARDTQATPRSIIARYPHDIVMKLSDLNEETGEFRAISVG